MLCLAFSLHLLPGDWNAIHPCVRFERDGWVAGAFLNSQGNISLSAGREWQGGPWWAEVGMATGYNAPIIPVARAGYDFGETRLFVAPAVTTDSDLGLVIGLQFNLGN